MLALSALTLVSVQFETFRAKLPEFQQFFNIHNAFLLAVVSGRDQGVSRIRTRSVVQALRRRVSRDGRHGSGADAVPLLQRFRLVDAAEQMGASGDRRGGHLRRSRAGVDRTFLWWFSEPDGLFHNLCLNVMFISSVTTIVFNANPLLRYDGYYILSDLTEIPNLRQKATTILSRKLGQWCLGLEAAGGPLPAAAKSVVFRVVLGCRGGLPLGRGVVDLLVSLQAVSVVSSGRSSAKSWL